MNRTDGWSRSVMFSVRLTPAERELLREGFKRAASSTIRTEADYLRRLIEAGHDPEVASLTLMS